MISPDAKPEELCDWFFPHLARALAHWGRKGFRRAYDAPSAGGETTLHLVVTSREEEDGPADVTLPEGLHRARPKTQDAYRALAALTAARGDRPAPVTPAEIIRWLRAWYAEQQPDPTTRDVPARATVHHSLTDLKEMGFAHQPAGGSGWLPGPGSVSRQATIEDVIGPAEEPDRVPHKKENTCANERMLTTASAPPSGRAPGRPRSVSTFRTHIWVPLSEDGLILDARTEEAVEPSDQRAGELTYETRLGRRRTVPAVRCELVRTEGEYAVARVGRSEIAVRVLGEWHLAGESCPDESEPQA